MHNTPRTILGQPSWRLASSSTEAFVTRTGGHLGPVTFDREGRALRPYAVAPWAEEAIKPPLPPILEALRGDFFCLPFGSNDKPFGGERHPLHGETANADWTFESMSSDEQRHTLRLSLQPRVRRGSIEKTITLVEGHPAVYCRHIVSGMKGPMPLGHHAMLQFPDRPGSGVLSTSPMLYGQVFPEPTELPENRGYSALEPGAEFKSLQAVPTTAGDVVDLTRYPARRGFEDIALIVSDPEVPFAWTAVAFPRERYVWFALKDPLVLHSTLFWFSNGGRHYPPWNGRHVNVLGLEEVTAYFHRGLAESAQINPLSAKGYATSIGLHPDRPLAVCYIMAATTTPPGFDRVVEINVRSDGGDGVTLRAASGKTVNVPLDLSLLANRAA